MKEYKMWRCWLVKKKMNQITFNLLDVNEMTELGGKIRFVFLLLFIRNIDFTSMELAI